MSPATPRPLPAGIARRLDSFAAAIVALRRLAELSPPDAHTARRAGAALTKYCQAILEGRLDPAARRVERTSTRTPQDDEADE